jgi:hypothetical protein
LPFFFFHWQGVFALDHFKNNLEVSITVFMKYVYIPKKNSKNMYAEGYLFLSKHYILKGFFFFFCISLFKVWSNTFHVIGLFKYKNKYTYVFSYFFFHMDNDIIDLSTKKKILCVPVDLIKR